ncbi:Uncharacterized protein APZ42_032912 [Daphnia magna]|uniref:Uncharacterized protein n=1 Tax=Daphnia magna TaxID=35525 RepID=A0A164LZN4_9CRUS|nr:Uncharacterized protein APZ42_032912 [Daphnia magna]
MHSTFYFILVFFFLLLFSITGIQLVLNFVFVNRACVFTVFVFKNCVIRVIFFYIFSMITFIVSFFVFYFD